MSKMYAGITIGPIVETLGLSSTPLGLWYSSYMFSTITRDICKDLVKNNFRLLTIPEMNEEEKTEFLNYSSSDGIGQFHDRIYITADVSKEKMADTIKAIIDEVIKKRAEEISGSLACEDSTEVKRWLNNYLQLHYVITELEDGESICDNLSQALDALELDLKIPSMIENNYIEKLIKGAEEDKNKFLKRFIGNNGIKIANLYEPENKNYFEGVNDLETIAKYGIKADSKANKYFAIVQADGDNMGKLTGSFAALGKELDDHEYLKKLENQEKRITKFSELCKEYAYDSSELIHDFGGVVIYAGGDDLLFLAPVFSENESGEIDDVWSLCKRIDDNFKDKFSRAEFKDTDEQPHDMNEFSKKPSLSFGISINYIKYPLYESLNDARDLLFAKAKNGVKNNIAINLHKHSGQSAGFIIPLTVNGDSGLFDSFKNLSTLFKKTVNRPDNPDNAFTSVLYHMEEMKKLVSVSYESDSDETLERLMNNLLDNQGLEGIKETRESVTALAKQIKKQKEALKPLNRNELDDVLSSMIRVNKFIIERGD